MKVAPAYAVGMTSRSRKIIRAAAESSVVVNKERRTFAQRDAKLNNRTRVVFSLSISANL